MNTGSNSPGDELITLRTSEVAVCCCSDLSAASPNREPRVLERNHRLVGEALQQLQFRRLERLQHIAVNNERSEGAAAGSQRRANHGANAGAACHRGTRPIRKLVIEVIKIGQMDLPVFPNHCTRQIAAPDGRTGGRIGIETAADLLGAQAYADRQSEGVTLGDAE